MEKGKLIVIEGTDCSGKETQSKKLIQNLKKDGIEATYYSFPNYETPTGKIAGLPYLGKPWLAEELINQYKDSVFEKVNMDKRNIAAKFLFDNIFDEIIKCLSTGWFPEGAPNVDPLVSSLYYAADRRYNKGKIEEILESGKSIVLDRYTYSNMGHQGGKIFDPIERQKKYEWISHLEFDMLELPQSDVRIFLHMPTDYTSILKSDRKEALDENERDADFLLNSENAFIEMARLYDFTTIECINYSIESEKAYIKTKEEISEEVYAEVKKRLTL